MYSEILHAWAIAYRKAGWCVIPAYNKRPSFDWKKYQTQLPTTEETQEWFEDIPEDGQIALVTGEISGVSVIDIDCHKEGCPAKKDGECNCFPEAPESFLPHFPSSLVSKTGSGGYHVFYGYHEKLGNSVGIAHPQLDVRSDGGIIILPPSLHDRFPNEYEWQTEWGVEAIRSLPTVPTFLLSMLKEKPKADWNRIVAGMGMGARNSSAAALAGKLASTFHDDDLGAAWELLRLWNTHKNSPPMDERELASTFKSIAQAEIAKRAKYGR